MLQYKWTSVTITTNAQANAMLQLFRLHRPTQGATDTETDGLNIGLCKPFLFQFGWLHPTLKEGYTFAVDLERQPDLAKQTIQAWLRLAEDLKIHIGHNIKFDMHMWTNAGFKYTKENLSDTQFYIRYGHNNLPVKEGGPPMGLKDYATKYIDPNAKLFENKIKRERSDIAKILNQKLRKKMPWKLKELQEFFKDPIADYHDLPPEVKPQYIDWLQNDVPIWLQPYVLSLVDPDTIPYNKLNREDVTTYAHLDIVYTLEILASLEPIVTNRENLKGVKFENQLIFPLFEMERVGFKADKVYLEQARVSIKDYIKTQRRALWSLVNQQLKVGQHAKIKALLKDQFDTLTEGTGKDKLDKLKADLIREGMKESDVVKFIELIQELRTLEKWYSTYILRFQKDLLRSDRLYTQINQVGTVSGRVTSDFQQFPKYAIKKVDGTELFHPRRIVQVSGNEYDALVYLDFSQIELRFQAFYTILVGSPDTNLCRAYMPFNCIDENGALFNYNNPADIQRWQEHWCYQESEETPWEPTDVHGATTTAATGLTPQDGAAYKKARSDIGKRTNFAKNYGAQRGKIREMFPEATEEEVTRINDAYYTAFPGVKTYHDYCYKRADYYSYTANLFGVKYYGVSGHKLINLLVQGSSAYYLKWKMRLIYDYCKQNNFQSRYILNIHDELQFEWHKEDDPKLLFDIKAIMEDWPDTKVPIVAEAEYTLTNWASKKPVHNLQEWEAVRNGMANN